MMKLAYSSMKMESVYSKVKAEDSHVEDEYGLT